MIERLDVVEFMERSCTEEASILIGADWRVGEVSKCGHREKESLLFPHQRVWKSVGFQCLLLENLQ